MIKISEEILDKWPEFNVGVLEFSIEIGTSELLNERINSLEEEIDSKYSIEDVIKIPSILSARNAYKAFGKDPSRYRLAVESLYRRLSKGNKLYRINNAVDIGNVLSILTKKSIAVLDKDEVKGDVLIRLGHESDDFHGIGRGKLNITNIPLYEDELGPFGSCTSDTERTMIREKTTNILLFIISFEGSDVLKDDIELATNLFSQFASVDIYKDYIL